MASSKDASKKPHDVESLVDVFRCFICMEKLQDARLCPYCSKLCCYPCIRRWLNEQHSHCPHCRATLHLHEMVNCRWAEDVTHHLSNIQQNSSTPTATATEDVSQRDICSDHGNEKLSVYCCTCQMCICHQCALWAGKHVGHDFKPLDEVYASHFQRVTEQVSLLHSQQIEYIAVIQEVERNVEAVRKAKDERVMEMRKILESMISRLEAQHRSKLHKLADLRNVLSMEMDDLENLLMWVENIKRSSSKQQLIATSADILDKIKQANRKPATSFVTSPIPSEFISEIVPQFESSTFMMSNFTAAQQLGEPVYSPPLNVYGLIWKLKIYPDGNGVVRGKFLSIFLELSDGSPESSEFEYRMEMVHPTNKDDGLNIVREFSSDFEVGDCWGYNRFFRLDLLASEGYLNLDTDTLVLRFYVRSPTYFQKSKDQQLYINKLKNIVKDQRLQIKNLQKKNSHISARHIPCRRGSTCSDCGKLLQPSRCRANNTMEDLMLINIDMEVEIQNKSKHQLTNDLCSVNDMGLTTPSDDSSLEELEEEDNASTKEFMGGEDAEGGEDGGEDQEEEDGQNLKSGSLNDSEEEDIKLPCEDEWESSDCILKSNSSSGPLNVSLNVDADAATPARCSLGLGTAAAVTAVQSFSPITSVIHKKTKMDSNVIKTDKDAPYGSKSIKRHTKEKPVTKWRYQEGLFVQPAHNGEFKVASVCKASKSESSLIMPSRFQKDFIPSIGQFSPSSILQNEISQNMNKYCIIDGNNLSTQSYLPFTNMMAMGNTSECDSNTLSDCNPSLKNFDTRQSARPILTSMSNNQLLRSPFNEEAENDADDDED